jgi:hypothetical protein
LMLVIFIGTVTEVRSMLHITVPFLD